MAVLLLIVAPIVGFCVCPKFCCALLCVLSSFAMILMAKRELDALYCLSSWCLGTVIVPWVGLQCVFVVFPDRTHLLFWDVCHG